MRILMCNDDGYQAPGILALRDVLSDLADIRIFAPQFNRSGASNAITLGKTIRVTRLSRDVMYVRGTPADCVHIALTGVLKNWKPDLVLTGINQGHNLGDDTLYSGTVAAALQGYLFDIPSIAFSQVDFGWAHLDTAAKIAREIVLKVYKKLPGPYLLNVNVPNIAYEEITGIKVTRLGRRQAAKPVTLDKKQGNVSHYYIGNVGDVFDGRRGTDFHAIENKAVSVTPLQIDLTDKKILSQLKAVFK